MRHFCNKQSGNPNSLACRILGKATNPQASWKPMRYYPNTPFCFKQRSPIARTYLRVVSFSGQTGALLGAKPAKLPRSRQAARLQARPAFAPHWRLCAIPAWPEHPTGLGRLFGCPGLGVCAGYSRRRPSPALRFRLKAANRSAGKGRVAPPPLFSLFSLFFLLFPFPLPRPSPLFPQSSPKQDPGKRAARNARAKRKLEPSSDRHFHCRAQVRARAQLKSNGLVNGAPSGAAGRGH